MFGLFANKKLTLLFAAGTLISAAVFVSEDGAGGALRASLEAKKNAGSEDTADYGGDYGADYEPEPEAPSEQTFGEATFASDDELIDDAMGFDPTPGGNSALVSDDSGGKADPDFDDNDPTKYVNPDAIEPAPLPPVSPSPAPNGEYDELYDF